MTNEDLLKENGWEVERESPLKIRHTLLGIINKRRCYELF